MALHVEYQNKDEHLEVQVEGEWILEDIENLIDEIKQRAIKGSFEKILIDARELKAPTQNAYMTRFYTGQQISKVLRPPMRVAAVSKSEIMAGETEMAARNRGAIFVVFTDVQDAINWLLQDINKL